MDLNYKILNTLCRKYGDSFYLLDYDRFAKNYDEFLKAFTKFYPKTILAYSYKTNYTPKLCKIINEKGGFAEVVSEMEYDLAIKIGVNPQNIIVNGPYKNKKILEKFLINGSIVNLDSYYEITLVKKIASHYPDRKFFIGIRCNFELKNLNRSRFGFDTNNDHFFKVFRDLKNIANIEIKCIHCHYPNRDIESFLERTNKIIRLSNILFPEFPPQYIDIGGGFFGYMDDTLKKQFDCKVPSYENYGRAIASKFREAFGKFQNNLKPTLILEPGTAIVADTMKFVCRVIEIKNVRGKYIAMTSGTRLNFSPLSSKLNMPIWVFGQDEVQSRKFFHSIDIFGYTCIEGDCLYKNYTGTLKRGDFIVIGNVGSYSIVFKPPFILPNVPILAYNKKRKVVEVIKRAETIEDIFKTFVF